MRTLRNVTIIMGVSLLVMACNKPETANTMAANETVPIVDETTTDANAMPMDMNATMNDTMSHNMMAPADNVGAMRGNGDSRGNGDTRSNTAAPGNGDTR